VKEKLLNQFLRSASDDNIIINNNVDGNNFVTLEKKKIGIGFERR
jgi:hypothetical protein